MQLQKRWEVSRSDLPPSGQDRKSHSLHPCYPRASACCKNGLYKFSAERCLTCGDRPIEMLIIVNCDKVAVRREEIVELYLQTCSSSLQCSGLPVSAACCQVREEPAMSSPTWQSPGRAATGCECCADGSAGCVTSPRWA